MQESFLFKGFMRPPLRQLENAVQIQPRVRRRWIYLMPAVFVTYSLAVLDRANYGFGAAAAGRGPESQR